MGDRPCCSAVRASQARISRYGSPVAASNLHLVWHSRLGLPSTAAQECALLYILGFGTKIEALAVVSGFLQIGLNDGPGSTNCNGCLGCTSRYARLPAKVVEGDGPLQIQDAPDAGEAQLGQVPRFAHTLLHQAHQHRHALSMTPVSKTSVALNKVKEPLCLFLQSGVSHRQTWTEGTAFAGGRDLCACLDTPSQHLNDTLKGTGRKKQVPQGGPTQADQSRAGLP